ncbi:hypothetical protein [Gandjariella thermophila]|uniref:TetR family transcriptional regulator n=1 Tax=Gandjariella thermophila TaxID=1931992 RepID=A0A4D4J4N9_9PSEU|nr:hypothetical protein [Gandjariella thermophila]GDY30424.1 hypothetical protein GTS_20570 [Gandjariella thermophila]
MSWNDFYQRRRAIDEVLRRAARDPRGPLPFADVPEAAEIFGSQDTLLLALHYKWMQLLTGRIGIALSAAERSPDVDRVEAVGTAWRELAAANPVLHAVLTTHLDEGDHRLRAAVEREQRMLALAAGLAEPDESAEEINRIGRAFLTLLRRTPLPVAKRRSPVELLRRMVPSG